MKSWSVSFESDPRVISHVMQSAGADLFKGGKRIWSIIHILSTCGLAPMGAAVLFCAIRVMLGYEPLPESMIILPAIAVVTGAVNLISLRQTYHVMARAAATSALGKSVEMILTPVGVSLKGSQSHWFTAWADLDNFTQERDVLMFRIGAVVLHLPRNAFKDPDEARAAIADCHSWYQNARAA